jgi:branched-chain amino acid transport system permease protein
MSLARLTRPVAGVSVLAAILAPFYLPAYENGRLTTMFCYALAILGINLLTGYAGQISVAQGAFFALGAYVAAISVTRGWMAPLLTIPVAGLVALAGGLVLGIPALRVRGLYLAVVTLAVAVAFPSIIKAADGLTGGDAGLSTNPLAAPAWSGLADDQLLYFLALVLLLGGLAIGALVRSRRAGRSLVVVRDRELLGTALGVRVARIKLEAFALSACFAGIAGAMFALSTGYVAPASFPLQLSLDLVIAMVIGGAASLAGAVLGAAFVVYIPVYASDISLGATGFIYGGALMACIYLLPGGLVSVPRRLVTAYQALRDRPGEVRQPSDRPAVPTPDQVAQIASPAREKR